jgi:hypothetical protein
VSITLQQQTDNAVFCLEIEYVLKIPGRDNSATQYCSSSNTTGAAPGLFFINLIPKYNGRPTMMIMEKSVSAIRVSNKAVLCNGSHCFNSLKKLTTPPIENMKLRNNKIIPSVIRKALFIYQDLCIPGIQSQPQNKCNGFLQFEIPGLTSIQ